METSLQNNDYTRRRGELSTFGRALNAANRIKLVAVLVALVAVAAMLATLFLPGKIPVFAGVIIVLIGMVTLWRLIQQHLIEPDLATRKWLQQICDGEFKSTIDLANEHPHYKELDFHTRNVGTTLSRLSDEMESLVTGQTQRLENQNQVLEADQQARVIEERVRLGAELHDSLAQTLLAGKYQLRMLRDTLQDRPADLVLKDIERVENILDEANVEVRELIGQTARSNYDHDFADSISSLIDDFNKSGGIPVFFQNDNPHMHVTERETSVILRIVRESLVNAGKYSSATNIRVYLRVEQTGVRSLLIEDDGVGFQSEISNETDTGIGEHIGLLIMRDRALSIGAILTIDSEQGEGTRISLKLPPISQPDDKLT